MAAKIIRAALPSTLWLLSACANDPGLPDVSEREDAALVGRLEQYEVDHGDGSYRNEYALRLDDGTHVELQFAVEPELHSGSRVVLNGRYVSNDEPLSLRDSLRLGPTRFAVDDARLERAAVGMVQQGLVAPPDVTVTGAVVLLNFKGKNAQNYTADTARKELAQVHDYYLEMSYGSWTMDTDVLGPYLVDAPSQCDLDTLGTLAKATARAQGVDIDQYDHVGVKIAGLDGLDCPCGVAYVGNTPAQGGISNGGTSLYTCSGANAYAHEMGHGIGLSHSSTAPCNGVAYRPGLSGCNIVEYGNRFNTMGGGLGHFNAMQKATLGWLNGCNIQRVSKDGEFDLTAIQVGVDNQAQGLQIDTGDTMSGGPLYFYVEYRNPTLAKFNALKDNGSPRERGPGLHVTVSRDFRSTQGEGRTILIDASNGLKGLPSDGSDADQAKGDPRMVVGDVFKPNAKVTIEFVSQTDKVAHVKVTFAGGGSGSNQCQSSAVPPGPPDVPEGYAATLFQDCDYEGGWSVSLPEGKYTTAELKALGVKDNDASSLVLAPGYDALLYADDNFGGKSSTRSRSLSCFTKIDMNDALSSIEIRSNGMAPGPDAGTGPDASVAQDAGGGGGGDGDMTPAGDGDAHGGDASTRAPDASAEEPSDGSEDDGKPAHHGGCSVHPQRSAGTPWALLGLGVLLGLGRLAATRARRRLVRA
ncbi:MAG: hypothetical protein QM778_34915 [Myxococcales bacterium]